MLSTGRFGMNLWAAVLGYGRAEPSYAFGIDLLAALLLALAAVASLRCCARPQIASACSAMGCLPACLSPTR